MTVRMTRRKAMQGAAATLASVPPAVASRAARAADTGEGVVRLRLMETSDLHSFVFSFDYVHNREDDKVGFGRTATLIRQARAEARNSLLFDNGDIIQGNALADFAADHAGRGGGGSSPHPMFAAMNGLGYVAATLGNHEFDFGLDYLRQAMSRAGFPFVCANARDAAGRLMLPPYVVIDRAVEDEAGGRHNLRIGVIGFVTPEFMTFDKSQIGGLASADDIVAAARRYVPELRGKADLVVALSHSGISDAVPEAGEENASLHLAEVPGIDVIFTGHQHRVFPGPVYAGLKGVDAVRGTLHGVPAVMPGFWGSHLGIIDLSLKETAGNWKVVDFRTEARPIYAMAGATAVPRVPADDAVLAPVTSEHAAAIAWFNRPFATTPHAITSYFAYTGPCGAVDVVTAALQRHAAAHLGAARDPAVPLLAASAPLKMGWQSPTAFTDIAAGPVALRDITDLWMDPNYLCIVRVNGAIIREWLEKAACIFNRLDPHDPAPQKLIDERIPSYAYDILSGVRYAIDPTQPARYAHDGRLIDRTARRVTALTLDGAPLAADRPVLVATNSWRADGGHHYPGLDGGNILWRSDVTIKEIVRRHLQTAPADALAPAAQWRLTSSGGPIAGTFRSGPGARHYLGSRPDLRELSPHATGAPPAGYLEIAAAIT